MYTVCREFKVLPTEKRFKELTWSQIMWLYECNQVYEAATDSPDTEIDYESLPEEIKENKYKITSEAKQIMDKFESGLAPSLEDLDNLINYKKKIDVKDFEDVTDEFNGAE
jgi:hypothetical protein